MGYVLFVDDEKMILNSMKRGLRKCDFETYYCTSGYEALKIIKEVDIDVIVSDMKMPEMNGLELLKKVDEYDPEIVKVIVSGYAQLPQLIATINQTNIFKYISKPFDIFGELIPTVKEALEYSNYRKESKLKSAALESKNEAYRNMFHRMKSKAITKDVGYDLIRIFQQIVMNQIKAQILDENLSRSDSEMYLNKYKRFCDYFLNEIKSNEIYFEANRIINEMKFVLKKDNYKVTIEKGVAENSKELYEGRGMHIKPVLLSLIQDYVTDTAVGSIKIVSTESNREENKVIVSYIIESTDSLLKDVNEDDYNFRLYKSLVNIFGGELTVTKKDRKVNIILKSRLYLSEREDDELTNS